MNYLDCLKSMFFLANATVWLVCPGARHCICEEGSQNIECVYSEESAAVLCGDYQDVVYDEEKTTMTLLPTSGSATYTESIPIDYTVGASDVDEPKEVRLSKNVGEVKRGMG